MSFNIYLMKVKELNLEILPNGKKYTFFLRLFKCDTHIQVHFNITLK